MAQTGYGVSIGVSDAGETYDNTVSPTILGEISNISPPSPTRDIIDVTHSQSAGQAREFITGLIDYGEASFDINWTPSNATDTLLRTVMLESTPREYQMTFPVVGGSDVTCTFSAFVTGFDANAPHDDKMSGSVTMKVTGAPVWA